MGDIHYHIPPRPSEDIVGVFFGEWVIPLEILITVSVAALFVILVSGSFYPCIKVIRWLVLVPTVGIAMSVIVTMLGAVVGDLEPGVTFAVLLFDPFIKGGVGRLGGNSWAGTYGIPRVQSLF